MQGIEQLERVSRARAALAEGRARVLRESAHLTQADLAEALGVSPASVSRWEARSRVPGRAASLRLARLLETLEKAAS